MKLISLVLIGALVIGGHTLGEAQQLPTLPAPSKPPPTPWDEKGTLRTLCLEEAQRLCSDKRGQDAAECRLRTAEKLCCGCKADTSQ